MTREEMCAFMDGLSEKMVEKLAKSGNPGVLLADGVFRDQVQTLSRLKYCIVAQAYPQPDSPISGQTTLFEPDLGTLASTNPEPVATEAPEPVKMDPLEEVTPVEEEAGSDTATGENIISKEELRDKLSHYSNKYETLDVAQIMADMGYGKLSEVPNSRYAELLERVEKCIKEGA